MIGVLGTFLVFLIRERKMIVSFISGLINMDRNKSISTRLDELMSVKGLSFEEAKEELIFEEIVNSLKISQRYLKLTRDLILYSGDKVSFVDEKIGYIQGEFIGVIESQLVGYEDLYILKENGSLNIRQGAISFIKVDTVNVYK